MSNQKISLKGIVYSSVLCFYYPVLTDIKDIMLATLTEKKNRSRQYCRNKKLQLNVNKSKRSIRKEVQNN